MTQPYIVIDFETFYSKDYTLQRLTPVEYILDPRFDCFGAAVAEGDDGSPQWMPHCKLVDYLKGKRALQRQGEKLKVVSHNALFDMCILSWRYGILPDLMIDTVAMSRALLRAFTPQGRVSLAAVAKYLGLPEKGLTLARTCGLNYQQIKDNGLLLEFAAYAVNDTFLCREIFKKLRGDFPLQEFLVADELIRCCVVPRFQANLDRLQRHLEVIRDGKAHLLSKVSWSILELMSNDKFAEALKELGVEPPLKVSPVTGKATYAFAKTDQAMADLMEHEDPMVQAVVAARIGMKSTLEETRTDRLVSIANLTWPGNLGERWMPIPLKYSGAHTHRFSGDWRLNPQNWPARPVSDLARAHEAPPGYVVVKADASQVECRIVCWLAGAKDVLKAFEQEVDIYSKFGTDHVYKRPISRETPRERFVCKQAVLGLGYQMGWPRYQAQVRKDSRLYLDAEIVLTDEEAQDVVKAYRRKLAPEVPRLWERLRSLISTMAAENSGIEVGPVVFEHKAILLPSGLRLFYHELHERESSEGMEWWFTYAGKHKKLFPGKLTENIVQALARIVNTDAMLRMRKLYPEHTLAHQKHDELIYVVPSNMGERFAADLVEAMRVRPSWAPDLPLAAESAIGWNYGDCK